MIKRTPQEWADITRCYVARDRDSQSFALYTHKPEINPKFNWWDDTGADSGNLPVDAVDVDLDTHNWTKLYEPSANSSEISKSKQDNAPHQSEVYVHKEYALLAANHPEKLAKQVTARLNEGWTLAGSIFVEHLSSNEGYVEDCVIYQAMVRGL